MDKFTPSVYVRRTFIMLNVLKHIIYIINIKHEKFKQCFLDLFCGGSWDDYTYICLYG